MKVLKPRLPKNAHLEKPRLSLYAIAYELKINNTSVFLFILVLNIEVGKYIY